jgi:hypothetical protein
LETVIVTLKLPADLFNLVKKYAKPFIVNDSLSNSVAIKNTSVLNSKLLESKAPSREEVEAEIKRIGASFTADRVFIYYSDPKHPWPANWKSALLRWKSYNLEKTTTSTSKNTPAKCDFANDASFQSSVADLLADGKKGVA